MKRKFLTSLALAACAVLALTTQAAAQGLVDAQRTRQALSTFPDSQAVLFVNIQKIVGDALPRFVPADQLQKLYTEPQKVGFDVKGVEYAIVGVRLAEPPPPNGIPEFVLFLRGTFNADSLLALGRIALDTQGIKAANENYGGKTLDIIDTASLKQKVEGDDPNKQSSGPPIPYKEIAATALDANTIVVGVPAYVRDAIDAAAGTGRGRLNAGLIDLATRDNNSLVSLTAALPPSIFQYLEKTGMPKNAEAERLIRSLRQVSLSTGMDALNFTLKASVHTETPSDASAISGFVRMGLAAAENALREELKKKRGAAADEPRAALAAIQTFTNTTEGDTLLLGFSVPQKTIAALAKKSMAKKSGSPGTTTRKGTGARRRRRPASKRLLILREASLKKTPEQKRTAEIIGLLKREYPDARCSLDHTNPLELLVATILSAQCTDERVNLVTAGLFRKYRGCEDYAAAPPAELENDIRPTGFFRNKAKAIQGACRMLLEEHGGRVPERMEDLLKLPGVARKTANVVLGNAYGIASGVVVDTHVSRLSQRLALSAATVPEKIEQDLLALVPERDWIQFPHLLIAHGRKVCKARTPLCAECVLEPRCPSSLLKAAGA